MSEKPSGVAAAQAAETDIGLAMQMVEGFEPVTLPPMTVTTQEWWAIQRAIDSLCGVEDLSAESTSADAAAAVTLRQLLARCAR